MKNVFSFIGCLALVLVILNGCRSTPTPANLPANTPAPASVAPSSVSRPTSPEETAMAEIVSAAKKEGRVTAYSFNMTGDVGQVVSTEFEKKYGIKVEIITGGGAALAERIRTEKRMGTTVADLMDANTFQISGIKDIGATVSSQELPVLQEKGVWVVDPWAIDSEKHMLIHTITYTTAYYNTDLVKPGDEPKSIKEMATSKWKGRMTAIDPRQTTGLSTVFPTLLARKLIDLETLKAIGMNDITFYPTTDEPPRALIQGRHALYFMGSTPQMGSLIISSGTSLPVKTMNAEEGTITYNRAVARVKDGPHPNAARLLINWLLSKDGQTVFLQAAGGVPVRKDVPDFTPATLRITPIRVVMPTVDEEKENTRLFREAWLAKLWGR
ncbi:MAG: extracellular solute-binding protein [Dehalococcoidia bacterium]|nr:extracellular solute-binding protein [Dehalococcoidia bacterium]